ncbi:MAG: hypothetical protein FWC64_07160 [Treponema sp.]|nr:hypothetical protein [Treponema sp.]
MAMNPQSMCEAIKEKLEEVTALTGWKDGKRPGDTAYTEAFDKGLIEYVENNMEIEYGWSAVSPSSGASDPVTSFSSRLVVADKIIGQPQNTAVWGQLIRACFSGGVIQHPSAFAGVAPGSLLTITPPVITPLHGDFPRPLLSACEHIYAWLLSTINPASLAGNHGPFIGATTRMVIR